MLYLMKRFYIISLLLTLSTLSQAQHIEKPGAGKFNSTVAIVVDDATWQAARTELLAYKQNLEARGLGAYILADDWKNPEAIRTLLHQLYTQKPRLEGALLVGHIPIPMLRDAQHLSSAFKMSQKIDWQRSSIPSDRYYDDFDLQFTFLKQDSLRSDYFYYSLAAHSPQQITMDIYTSRIKPPMTEGVDYDEAMRAYLRKLVAVHAEHNEVNQLMMYTGHGYNTESLNAWAGEQIALREQFPAVYKPGGQARMMNYRMEPFMKFNLLSEVQREDLDLAIFHGHGTEEAQLINGYAEVSNPNPSIENVRRYLRSKIQSAHRRGKNVEEVKQHFAASLGVPDAWMTDALVDSVMQADSIFDANINISIADVDRITPNARMIMLDHCDNGEFQLDDYIAGHYAFGTGKTMVVLANSVGVLQDQWPDQMLGLLQYGTRIGNWFKQIAYLETHLFGDATYAFAASSSQDLNSPIVNATQNAAPWNKLLKVADPDIQALALKQITRLKGAAMSSVLKETYFTSPWGTTRMEALALLNELNTPEFITVLQAAVDDPYELVQRLAVSMIGEQGSDELIPPLVHAAIDYDYSKRVSYRARQSMSFMNIDRVLAEIDRQIAAAHYLADPEGIKQHLTEGLERTRTQVKEEFISMATLPAKERRFSIRSLRVYRYHMAVPTVCQVVQNPEEETHTRVAALEALSWFTHSYERPVILKLCQQLIHDNTTPQAVKAQAEKTQTILY